MGATTDIQKIDSETAEVTTYYSQKVRMSRANLLLEKANLEKKLADINAVLDELDKV